jgi:membrane protease YdiL (CAAX protease family)
MAGHTLDIATTPPQALWWACALLAPPIAWIATAHGYGIAGHGGPLRDLAVLATVAVVEEIVFRGGIQSVLRRRFGLTAQALGVSAANAIASVLFALAHLWAHPPLAALGVWPVSLVLGAAYERQGERLLAPVVLHLYFNGLLYAASRWLPP